MRTPVSRLVFVTALALLPAASVAHSFVLPYDLPVPFRLYLYACIGTLVLTFAVVAYFVGMPAGTAVSPARCVEDYRAFVALPQLALHTLRALAVGCLLLTIVSGFIGTQNPDANINMILFWVIFVLGFTYTTALVGNLFAFINPWQTVVEWFEWDGVQRPRLAYPARLGYWPALLFYISLIWIELFTLPQPQALSIVLVVYSLATFAGVWLFGKTEWFRYGELFSVLLRLVGLLAPLAYKPSDDGKSLSVLMRPPFSGVPSEHPEHFSLVLFVLFMLSSTTFDGMHETLVWMNLFWKHLIVLFQPLWGTDLLSSQRILEHWYVAYQRAGLVLSPFLYLAVYLVVIIGVKTVTSTAIPLREMVLKFAYTILPIAIVYNMAHYWTMMLTRAPRLPYVVSDPFGFGWNLLRLSLPAPEPSPLYTGEIWNTEVALIVAGHLVGVYLSHRIALRIFPSRRGAILSQLPILLLMLAYTVVGLWVISQPLALEG